jgi:exodeoxyribonuclease VII large subunit
MSKTNKSKTPDSDDSDNLSNELNQIIGTKKYIKTDKIDKKLIKEKEEVKQEIKEIKEIKEVKPLSSVEILDNVYNELTGVLAGSNTNVLTGEIISFKISDPNAYITIKIFDYQISGIFWSISKNKNILEYRKLVDGDKIKVFGNFSMSKKNLSIYFNIKSIEKVGLGDYLQLHNQMRNKIIDLGWDKNKSTLNKFPLSIGIVTSIEGAAIQDILQTFRADNLVGNILIINAVVQGKSCPYSVIQAIEHLEISHPQLDILLVTRGGGSFEDLVGFSDWDLITKIKHTHFLTMSAIGHQIDNQLSDEVADYKFPTPTYAAKFIVETQQKYFNKYYHFKDLVEDLENNLVSSKEKLQKISQNYNQIISNYNIKEYKEKLYKYSNKINQVLNSYHNAKKSYYNFISNMKPTIIKNGLEVTSILQLLETPKKMDIILPDGSVNVTYRVLDSNI